MKLGKALFLILLLLFPLGQLISLPLAIPGANIYLHDLILGLIWLWLFLFFPGFYKKGLGKRMIAFALIAFFTWLVNLSHWGRASFLNLGYLIRWLLLTGPYFLTLKLLETKEIDKEKILRLLSLAVFLIALFGWFQYLLLPDVRYLKYFGWDDHYYRLIGPLLDPNFMGLILVLGLGIDFLRKKQNLFFQFFLLITLALTYSRSSWLAWLVLLASWGLNQIFAKPIKRDFFLPLRTLFRAFRFPLLCLSILISLLAFYFVPKPEGEGGNLMRTASAQARFQSWENNWQIIKSSPIFGVGFNNYRLAQKEADFLEKNWQTTHSGAGGDNSFLFVWATTGIFGLIAFLWLVAKWRPWFFILPIMVHSFFNNSLFYPWVLILIWGIQGLGARDGT